MIQNILALLIVGAVVVRAIYSVYKAITTKDKSLCGGCASCELKSELKKKRKLLTVSDRKDSKLTIQIGDMKYSGK